MRRSFLKILGLTLISSILLPINFLYAATKKLLNKELSDEQKKIMFNEGTERPFSSELNKEKGKGFYHCANCGAKLFASTSKFDSGTGWPSFSEALPGAFKTKVDRKFGMVRTEYHCANCGVHHGHVFNDGPKTTGKRFCNNGLCLVFKPSN
jgi:peptide-methionine (R)-S-oxide reductase